MSQRKTLLKMPLKFAANISVMFQEIGNLPDRYQAAKDAGFTAVEAQFPYDFSAEEFSTYHRQSGLSHVLLNSFPGDLASGELGFAARPHYVGEFRSSLDLTIKYAKALNCQKVHVLAGKMSKHIQDEETELTYVENLKYAAETLQQEGIMALIEPQSPSVNPQYFLTNFDKAVEYIKKVNHPNLKLLLDIFHLQLVAGNLTANIEKFLPYTGHIQVSQAPLRDHLSAPGEINYEYILDILEQKNYSDWIGLEYKSASDTKNTLPWLQGSRFWS